MNIVPYAEQFKSDDEVKISVNTEDVVATKEVDIFLTRRTARCFAV